MTRIHTTEKFGPFFLDGAERSSTCPHLNPTYAPSVCPTCHHSNTSTNDSSLGLSEHLAYFWPRDAHAMRGINCRLYA